MTSINYRPGTHRFLYREQGIAYVVQSHGSVLDALHYAEKNKAWPRHLCSSLRTDSAAFHGTPDWPTALDLARFGWPEGRTLLRKVSVAMPTAALQERVVQWDVAGAYPDVARASAGAPDCMMADQPVEARPSQAVRVVVSIATPWTTSLAEFVNRGAAILSAVEAAEAAGLRVEVVAEETATLQGNSFSVSILLKSAGHPADRDTLAFFLIHPSALRRVFFALLETEPHLAHFSSCYGVPQPQPAVLRPPGAVYLPNFQTGQYTSPADALQRVKIAFEAAGCALKYA
jgi:hypothetical protein